MAKVLLNVRVDAELRETLKRIAVEENRQLSNLVETALKQFAAERAGSEKFTAAVRREREA